MMITKMIFKDNPWPNLILIKKNPCTMRKIRIEDLKEALVTIIKTVAKI